MKIFTAPQHIRSILPPIHPTKSSLRYANAVPPQTLLMVRT